MTDVRALASGDPARVGDFELLGRVGEGAQGMVYLARDPNGGQVAVKLLKAHLDADIAARERFVQELASAKRVARFCTAQVIDADLEGDRPYIVSEYVPGRSLAQVVNADGPLSGGALERLAIGTATALVAIHKANVVHRDFKPHNVLLGPDGPRVIDFGIAKALDTTATVSSAVVGTPAYMAPEQVEGAALGPAVDIFAWASTMVFAATGMPPFGQDSIPAVIGRLLHGSPQIGNLTGPVRELVDAALARDPALRPSAQQILLRLLGHDIVADPITTAPREILEEAATMVAMSAVPSASENTAATVPVAEAPMPAASTQPGQYAQLGQYAAPGTPPGQYAALGTPPGQYAVPGTPPGGFPAGFPIGPPGPPPRRRRGPAVPIIGTTVAVALILLLGGVVGYKILQSGAHSSRKSSSTTTAVTGSPAGDATNSPIASAKTSASGSSSPNSGGSSTVTVPAVAGNAKSYAIGLLQAKGLAYSMREQYSSSVEAGYVIGSDPSGGSSTSAGGTVTLFVSKGPKPVACKVPDLTGMTGDHAYSALAAAGLHGSASGGSGASDDVVSAQSPSPGSSCQPGDTVTYTLSPAHPVDPPTSPTPAAS